MSVSITLGECSSETGKLCYWKTARVHKGQVWSKTATPAAAIEGCLRDCPAVCTPPLQSCPAFAVCRLKLSGCHGCFSRCGVPDADLHLKVELQLQVLLPPSGCACLL